MQLERLRAKPAVVVEAYQIQGPDFNVNEESYVDENGNMYYPPPPQELEDVASWLGTQVTCGHDKTYEVLVHTVEGPKYARAGDWIVKDYGEYYRVLSQEVVDELYEPAG